MNLIDEFARSAPCKYLLHRSIIKVIPSTIRRMFFEMIYIGGHLGRGSFLRTGQKNSPFCFNLVDSLKGSGTSVRWSIRNLTVCSWIFFEMMCFVGHVVRGSFLRTCQKHFPFLFNSVYSLKRSGSFVRWSIRKFIWQESAKSGAIRCWRFIDEGLFVVHLVRREFVD